MIKRALISVTDKTGIVDFAKELEKLGYEIVSTGNTHKTLIENGVAAISVEDVTKFPEILDGRVKTLNPYIHGGILYKRDNKSHIEKINELNINPIDIVVVNLYDFEGALNANKDMDGMIEAIDIGGPSMIRASAKNYKDVLVVVSPKDYDEVIKRLNSDEVTIDFRLGLTHKAFSYTAHYDCLISNYFSQLIGEKYPDYLNLTFEKQYSLRYGENPHQAASYYKNSFVDESILDFEKLNGKELSFNNINDLYAALNIMKDFNEEIVAVGIKHANPCGVGIGETEDSAFEKCYESDKTSIFGGIVGINGTIDEKLASRLNEIFLEIVVAYDFTEEGLRVLREKKNLRVLKVKKVVKAQEQYDLKYLSGRLLVQDENTHLLKDLTVATKKSPTDEQLKDMEFGMKVVKHIKSNAVVIVKDGATLAIGGGQTARIIALKNAIENNKDKDLKDSVLASDAFFPFADCVELAAENNIAAIVQPGGSMNDEASIKACDSLGISMVLTGIRHFKH